MLTFMLFKSKPICSVWWKNSFQLKTQLELKLRRYSGPAGPGLDAALHTALETSHPHVVLNTYRVSRLSLHLSIKWIWNFTSRAEQHSTAHTVLLLSQSSGWSASPALRQQTHVHFLSVLLIFCFLMTCCAGKMALESLGDAEYWSGP